MSAYGPAALGPARASGAVITVENASFEDGLTGWTAGGAAATEVSSTTITWQYPDVPDGTHWLMINAGAHHVNYAWQQVGTVNASQTYTLTFTAGNSVVSNTSAPYFYAGLYTDDGIGGIANTPLAQISDADVTWTQVAPDDTQRDDIVTGNATVTFDASAAPQEAGKNLYIFFSSKPNGWYNHTLFDAVTLNGTTVPEPASAAILLGLGGMGLLTGRGQQRKA